LALKWVDVAQMICTLLAVYYKAPEGSLYEQTPPLK